VSSAAAALPVFRRKHFDAREGGFRFFGVKPLDHMTAWP